MKKISFLVRLHREGKLVLTDPSGEVEEAYRGKSESHLISAKILLENDRLEESVSMAYYSMYHMLLALLYKTGIKCENHSAAIILLERVFGLDNSVILSAKRERIDKQYYIDYSITRQEVGELVETAEKFNAQVRDYMERLSTGEVLEFRAKAERLLKKT